MMVVYLEKLGVASECVSSVWMYGCMYVCMYVCIMGVQRQCGMHMPTRDAAIGTAWYIVPTRNPKPETLNPKSDTLNPKP